MHYLENPKLCKACLSILPYVLRYNNFCNHSCSAIFNNSKRVAKELWNCKNCNREHLTVPYRKRNFCNKKCTLEFKNKERIDNWKLTGEIESKTIPPWLKRYILKKQESKCNRCSIDKWNNEDIVLELEHKDGNSNNNKEENLCCLCPNCHSQTPTFKAKNKGNGREYRRKKLDSII